MKDMVQACLDNDIIPIVLTLMPASNINTAQELQDRIDFNIALNDLPNTHAGTIIVGTSGIENPGDPTAIDAAYDQGDGIHLNEAGHAFVAALIHAAINAQPGTTVPALTLYGLSQVQINAITPGPTEYV